MIVPMKKISLVVMGDKKREALKKLRKAGIEKPILVLGYSFPECFEDIVKYDIRQTVFQFEMAELLSKEAVKQNKKVFGHVKLDTGMGRIGYQKVEEAVHDTVKMKNLPMLELEGVFTHFANADTKNQEFTFQQLSKFEEMIRAMEAEGVTFELKHCANSAGIIELTEQKFDLVRAGIISYGLWQGIIRALTEVMTLSMIGLQTDKLI